MCPVTVLSTAGHSLHALHMNMFTLLVLGMSCAAVYDRWLLINRCMSSGLSSSRTRQPTRSWQTAQRTKLICCLGNCYFGSTLDFQHTVRSDEILVSHLKGEAETASCLSIICFFDCSLWSSPSFPLFHPLSFLLRMFFSAEVEGCERRGGGTALVGEAAAWKLIW